MALRVSGILNMDGSGFFSTLNRAESAVQKFGRSVTSNVGGRIAGLFSAGALGMLAKRAMDLAGRITDLSLRTNTAAEELQRMQRAAEDNGSSLETVVSVFDKLAVARDKALRSPGGAQSAAFGVFGINESDLRSLSPNALLGKIASKFQSGNLDELTAPLIAVGGKAAMELVAGFRNGWTEGYQDLVVMSEAQTDILDQLGDSWDGLMMRLTVSVGQFAVTAVNILQKGINELEKVAQLGYGESQKWGAGFGNTRGSDWIPYRHLFSGKFWNRPSGGMGRDLLGMLNPFEMGTQNLWQGYSAAAPEVNDSTAMAVADIEKEFDEMVAGMAKARAARIAARGSHVALDFSDLAPTEAVKSVTGKPQADSMLAVGNFLGTNQNNLTRIQAQALDMLRAIERNTRPSQQTDSLGLEP